MRNETCFILKFFILREYVVIDRLCCAHTVMLELVGGGGGYPFHFSSGLN